MKTRILSVFAALALLLGLLSACGRTSEPEASPTPEPTADPHAGMVEVSDGAGGTMWVRKIDELAPFGMDRTAFSVGDDAATYAGEGYSLLRGVDVSDHQGEIDWYAVAESGVQFAIIRCGWRGYGGGSLNEDSRFRENIEGAKRAGLKVGVYFFSQAVSILEAAEEAVYTASLLEDYTLDLPVFFDWEFIGTEPARTDGVDGATVTDACLEFCRLMSSAGYDTGVYGYMSLMYFTYELERLAGLTLWIGDPGTWPEFYYQHRFWQYSFTASVPGIEGDVDLDVMYRVETPPLVDISETATPQPEEAQG